MARQYGDTDIWETLMEYGISASAKLMFRFLTSNPATSKKGAFTGLFSLTIAKIASSLEISRPDVAEAIEELQSAHEGLNLDPLLWYDDNLFFIPYINIEQLAYKKKGDWEKMLVNAVKLGDEICYKKKELNQAYAAFCDFYSQEIISIENLLPENAMRYVRVPDIETENSGINRDTTGSHLPENDGRPPQNDGRPPQNDGTPFYTAAVYPVSRGTPPHITNENSQSDADCMSFPTTHKNEELRKENKVPLFLEGERGNLAGAASAPLPDAPTGQDTNFPPENFSDADILQEEATDDEFLTIEDNGGGESSEEVIDGDRTGVDGSDEGFSIEEFDHAMAEEREKWSSPDALRDMEDFNNGYS